MRKLNWLDIVTTASITAALIFDGGAGLLRLLGFRLSRPEDIGVGVALAALVWVENRMFLRFANARRITTRGGALHEFVRIAIVLMLAKVGFHDENLSGVPVLSDLLRAGLLSAIFVHCTYGRLVAASTREGRQATNVDPLAAPRTA